MRLKNYLLTEAVKVYNEGGKPVKIIKQTKGKIIVQDIGRADMWNFVIMKNLKNDANEYGRMKPEEHPEGIMVQGIPTSNAEGKKLKGSIRQWYKSFYLQGIKIIQNDDNTWRIE